jgi:hypothetical protein
MLILDDETTLPLELTVNRTNVAHLSSLQNLKFWFDFGFKLNGADCVKQFFRVTSVFSHLN